MKANAPKRKVFQDALDLLAEDPVQDTSVAVNGIVSIPVEEIHPFYDHPFRLYEGDRLEDMVQSIRAYGVLNPVIVRKAARGYEMLAGHNRTNAAKIAGLTEVPAIVKTDLSDEDAYVYVIETNLLQRSFAELLPSEKAAVLVARYEKISSQGKRNDIRQEIEALEETCGHDVHKSRQRTCGHDVHKSQKSRDGLGEEYGMTGRNIARYMRLDRLIPEFKDAPEIPMRWSWRMWKRIPVVRRRQGRRRGMWCGMALRRSRCRFLLRRSGLRSWQGMRNWIRSACSILMWRHRS